MPSPLELQTAMTGALRRAVPTPDLTVPVLAALATPDRLRVHARNLRSSLTDALASVFRRTRELVSEGFFAYAAASFIAAQPPRDPIVALYGGDFPAFLGGFAPAAHLAWLPHLARLEWQMQALSDEPAARPFHIALPAGAADARLRPNPSVALFDAPFAVDRLLICADSHDGNDTATIAGECRLLIRSADDAVVWRALPPTEHGFLSALCDGEALSAAIECALGDDPRFDFAAALARACAEGCFVDIKLLPET